MLDIKFIRENKDLIKEFLDFGLAVSSAKRIAQKKLPLQLK